MPNTHADTEHLSTLAIDPADWGGSPQALPNESVASEYEPEGGAGDPLATIGHIGRYALKYKIGEGGLGSVYAAYDPVLSRLIAIKTLNVEIEDRKRSDFNSVFLNEARASAGLSHPHIVTVFDAGVSTENKAYIAMELLKGRDLRQLRKEGWRPTHSQAALIVRRVADALAYAHSRGVVHCDIKPANIFMVSRTQPRVLDFGIARVTHQHETTSQQDIIGGSPYYIAPEQIQQKTVDRRTDVYALGVVLYELLTDQKPFRGNNPEELRESVLNHAPPPAHTRGIGIPKALSDIAAKAMERDPENRTPSARAMAKELRQWLDESGQVAEADQEHFTPAQTRGVLGVVAAVAALIALGCWSWFSHRAEENKAKAMESTTAVNAARTPPLTEPTGLPNSTEQALDATVLAASSEAALFAGAPLTPTLPLPLASQLPLTSPVQLMPLSPSTPRVVSLGSAPSASSAPTRPPAREAIRDRKARESRELENIANHASPAPIITGVVRIAVMPWGQVEVDGNPVGIAPPLNEITLPEGKHQIIIRNSDFPPYTASVKVVAGQPLSIKHSFGP